MSDRPQTIVEESRWRLADLRLLELKITSAMSGKTDGDRGFVVAQLLKQLRDDLMNFETFMTEANQTKRLREIAEWEAKQGIPTEGAKYTNANFNFNRDAAGYASNAPKCPGCGSNTPDISVGICKDPFHGTVITSAAQDTG